MTPKEFLRKMRKIEPPTGADLQVPHELADDLMCETLKSLGYSEGVDIFERMSKWYA